MHWFRIMAAAGMMTMTAQADAMDHAARAAILDAARAPVTRALGKPVLFRVDRLKVEGDWAFLLAAMEESGGRRIDYAGTAKAAAAAEGMVSDRYAALLRRTNGHWAVVADAIGPTDVAWEDWPKRYGAPATIVQP